MSAIRWSPGWGPYHDVDPRRRAIQEESLSKMIAFSFLIHFFFFSFLLLSRPLWSARSSTFQSYQVSLVSPEPAPAPLPLSDALLSPKAASPREARGTPKIVTQKGTPPSRNDPKRLQEWWKKKVGSIKIAPVQPKSPAAEPAPPPRLDLTKRPDPSPDRAEPDSAGRSPKRDLLLSKKPMEPPAAPAPEPKEGESHPSIVALGSASLNKSLFKFPYYLQNIENKISGQWAVPPMIVEGEGAEAIILFRLRKTGRIESVEIEKSSGNAPFDQSALRAVYNADPLPPFPDGLTEDPLQIHFSFRMGS